MDVLLSILDVILQKNNIATDNEQKLTKQPDLVYLTLLLMMGVLWLGQKI